MKDVLLVVRKHRIIDCPRKDNPLFPSLMKTGLPRQEQSAGQSPRPWVRLTGSKTNIPAEAKVDCQEEDDEFLPDGDYLFQNPICGVSEEDSSGDQQDGTEVQETVGVLPDSEDDFYLMSGEAYNCNVAAMEIIPVGTLKAEEDRFDLLPVAAAPYLWTEARGTPCESFRVGEVPIHWMDAGNTKTSPMSDVDKTPKTVTRSMGTNTDEVTVLHGDANELTVMLPRSTCSSQHVRRFRSGC